MATHVQSKTPCAALPGARWSSTLLAPISPVPHTACCDPRWFRWLEASSIVFMAPEGAASGCTSCVSSGTFLLRPFDDVAVRPSAVSGTGCLRAWLAGDVVCVWCVHCMCRSARSPPYSPTPSFDPHPLSFARYPMWCLESCPLTCGSACVSVLSPTPCPTHDWQDTTMAIQIPLFYSGGQMHSYVLSYRAGIAAAAAGLSIHQGWFSGIGNGA